MRAGLGASHAQDTVAVVLQVSGMSPQRATLRSHSLAIGWTAFEAGVAVATAAAGSDLSA